ncbi:MAG TPA: sensor histidine kinase KdpD [Bryobacteraceae bacterium]|nr:sensor histidine kinase KdpD [Bryobacteraceae bacterium]
MTPPPPNLNEPEAPPRRRGELTIFLGYAAGVGKTYKMLEEAQEARRHGRDVVVGYFEPHGRLDTIQKTEGLEMIPRRKLTYRGREFEEMDTAAILARHPEICAVDEFPHTNVPGAERVKRWEDVMVLLESGISVMTTMNVQHLESLNDQVRDITGIRVRETIPDWVVEQADEVVLIDVPPAALLNRLHRGAIYGKEKAQQAMTNFFKESTLGALREIALRQTAHEVDVRQDGASAAGLTRVTDSAERILIHINESPAAAALIRRGKRVADYLQADCFAVTVVPQGGMAALPREDRESIERHLDFARKLRIETRVLQSESPAEAIVQFARENGIVQIFLSKPANRPIGWMRKNDLVMQVVRLADDRQVTVVAERRPVG